MELTVTANLVSSATLGTDLVTLGTVNGTSKFISSTAVGVFWSIISPVFAFGLAALLMMAGTVLLARVGRDERTV